MQRVGGPVRGFVHINARHTEKSVNSVNVAMEDSKVQGSVSSIDNLCSESDYNRRTYVHVCLLFIPALDSKLFEQRVVALSLDLRPVDPAIVDVAATVEESLNVIGGVVENGHTQGREVHVSEVWHSRNSGAVEKLNILRKIEPFGQKIRLIYT